MAYGPCKNPNCNSFGKPHPNCKCYGEMAAGGDVGAFCSGDRKHNSDCEYFADGGEVPSGELAHEDPSHAVACHIANSGLLGMLKMDNIHDMEKYDRSVKKGHKYLDSSLEKIFSGEKLHSLEDRSKHHDHIDHWISKGGIEHSLQQDIYKQHSPEHGFAEGGEVGHNIPTGVLNSHPVEAAYPAQNMVLQGAKARASKYLQSLRPQEMNPKLAFDDHPDQTKSNKIYKNAVKIADHPMSILHDIGKGTIEQEHLMHLSAMYPELHDAMQKKITEKIISSQLNGKKPNYKTRQSLSLLLGTPLSSELTPQNIMAAQAVFSQARAQKAPEQGAPAPKKSTSSLSKSDSSFLTGGQALTKRGQRTK